MKIYFSLLVTTLVQSLSLAAADVQEVSYDDLINQLHQKKSAVMQNANDPWDSNKIHAGFGLISSANSVSVRGNSAVKYQNGFQLSMGIDLFSPSWAAEAALRNFGQSHSGTEYRSLREFDLKFMHRDSLSQGMGYRLGAGIGNRYLKVDDRENEVAIEDNTATSIFFGGLEAFVNKSLSIGVEMGLRMSMVGNTADRNAGDVMIRMDTYF